MIGEESVRLRWSDPGEDLLEMIADEVPDGGGVLVMA